MSYEFYKVLHIAGIFMVMTAIGAHLAIALTGASRDFAGKRFVGIMHGVGLLVTFVAGFGLMARLFGQGTSWPVWIYLKMAIWLLFGMVTLLPKRFPQHAQWIWLLVIVIGGVAAYLARYKPF